MSTRPATLIFLFLSLLITIPSRLLARAPSLREPFQAGSRTLRA